MMEVQKAHFSKRWQKIEIAVVDDPLKILLSPSFLDRSCCLLILTERKPISIHVEFAISLMLFQSCFLCQPCAFQIVKQRF